MDEKEIILKAVEGFVRKGSTRDGEVMVTALPNNRTSCVEQFEGEGRSVMLDQFKVDGKVVWAGYSSRSRTVFVSMIGSM
jgi:N-dimethylarginine dimethylaminohydrolase